MALFGQETGDASMEGSWAISGHLQRHEPFNPASLPLGLYPISKLAHLEMAQVRASHVNRCWKW